MNNREQEIRDLLWADSIMQTLLPGGIYTEQEVGVEDIRRDEGSPTADAFNDKGTLQPCAVVRAGEITPYEEWRVQKEKITPVMQMVYIYFYEFRGESEIKAAKDRAYLLLEGERLPDSYPLVWAFETQPIYDSGPVKNSTTLRQDWQIISLRRPG